MGNKNTKVRRSTSSGVTIVQILATSMQLLLLVESTLHSPLVYLLVGYVLVLFKQTPVEMLRESRTGKVSPARQII